MKHTEDIDQNPLHNPKSASQKWLFRLGLATIVLATLIAYLPAMHAGFIWDDDAYVTDNRLLEDFSGLGKIWSLRLITKSDGRQYLTSHTVHYYPLVFTSFWLDSHLWGQANPTGFHVVNVLLHIANALLVWIICTRLGFSWGFVAAAIFALHPAEVESVAWITERKNVLSGLFFLLTLFSYLRFDQSRRKVFYLIALGCFILALLAKTAICTMPAFLLLILWLRHRRIPWADALLLIPFFAAGAALGMFTAYLERYTLGGVGTELQAAFWQRCVIAGRAMFFYSYNLLCPLKLIFIYPRWKPEEFSFLGLIWPGLVIVITFTLWYWRKSIGRAPLVAWAGFAITLFPALGFFNVYAFNFSFVADHWQYHASIFFIALVVGLGHSLYMLLCARGSKLLFGPGVQILLTSIVLLPLGYLTYTQSRIYDNVETLWSKTIESNPEAWMAWNNRAGEYFTKGEYELAIRDLDQAIKLNPSWPNAYNNRGRAYLKIGEYELAIQDLSKAIEFDTSHYLGYLPYANRANAYASNGQDELAIRDFSKAIQLNHNFAMAYANRGAIYERKGEHELAIKDFRKAIELNPTFAPTHFSMAVSLQRQGKAKEAVSYYLQALRLQADWLPVMNNLAWILATHQDAEVRDGAEAVRLAERACELSQYKLPVTLDTLATAYAEAGQFDQAVKNAEKAIKLAQASGKETLAKAIQDRLELYKVKRPYRE